MASYAISVTISAHFHGFIITRESPIKYGAEQSCALGIEMNHVRLIQFFTNLSRPIFVLARPLLAHAKNRLEGNGPPTNSKGKRRRIVNVLGKREDGLTIQTTEITFHLFTFGRSKRGLVLKNNFYLPESALMAEPGYGI